MVLKNKDMDTNYHNDISNLNSMPWLILPCLLPIHVTFLSSYNERPMFNFKTSFFNCCSSTVVSIFPSLLPPSILNPFGLVHESFIHVPWWPFPFPPKYSPPSSPLVTVSLLLIWVSLVLFSLLVGFVD